MNDHWAVYILGSSQDTHWSAGCQILIFKLSAAYVYSFVNDAGYMDTQSWSTLYSPALRVETVSCLSFINGFASVDNFYVELHSTGRTVIYHSGPETLASQVIHG